MSSPKKKRALIIGPGGMRGAYDAGVVSVMARELGPDYFDAVYGVSGGSYTGAFFIANQPDVIEHTWQHDLHGRKFFSLLKIFQGKRSLDIDYLVGLFMQGKYKLDVDAVMNSQTKLYFVVSNHPSGDPVYMPVQEQGAENIEAVLKAAAAVPLFYRPITVNGKQYSDMGALVDPLPIGRALDDGYDEIIAIYNKPRGFKVPLWFHGARIALSPFLPKTYRKILREQEKRWRRLDELLKNSQQVTVIRPSTRLPIVSIVDTKKKRIKETFNFGVADGKRFIALLRKQ